MSLTRKNLIENIYRQLKTEYKTCKISRHLVHEAVETILWLLVEAFKRGERVSIKGLGRFEVRSTKRQKAYDFSRSQTMLISPKRKITFKTSSILKEKLKDSY